MFKEVLSNLAKPGPEFRGAPFWAWNSKLEPEELRRQIRLFKRMGMGGFFMHSRVGMNTPYLQKEWFECIDSCVDEAKKQDLYAWLYDEDRWPSGDAGGIVTKNPEFRERHIYAEWAPAASGLTSLPEERLGGVYSAVVEGSMRSSAVRAHDFKRLETLPEKAPEGRQLVVFYVRAEKANSWYNGQTYIDTMNPEAVAKFIEVTHEAYRKHYGDEFGGKIPGIFTDEPNYGNPDWPASMRPWSLHLAEEFGKRRGYDLLEHLPELFFNLPDNDFSKVRYDYYRTCTELFTAAYYQQIGQWCEKNNLAFTGHALYEDDLYTQRGASGDVMRFYEFQQIPGIDLLTERDDVIDTPKQCSSVAHQLDKPVRLCEAYGCTGWDFPFAGHKALGDWLQVLGINFRVQHLAWYSMRGEAKRDYPASISFQSSWWPQYHMVEDYFARQRAVLDPAKEQRDLLVISPIESYWGYHAGVDRADHLAYCDSHMVDLRNLLLGSQIDFDYGCEDMLPRHSSVSDALPEEFLGGAPRLQVGVARYAAVLLPPMETIRSTTLELLEKFAQAGGTVWYLNVPSHVDAMPDETLARRYRKAFHKLSMRNAAGAISSALSRVIVSTSHKKSQENGALFCQVREAGDYQALFVVNTGMLHKGTYQDIPRCVDRKIKYDWALLCWRGRKNFRYIYEVDQETGKIHEVDMQSDNAGNEEHTPHNNDTWACFCTDFAPLQSRLFIALEHPFKEALPARNAPHETTDIFELGHCFDYSLSEANAMVLDHAAFTAVCSDGKRLERNHVQQILLIDNELRDMLGAEHRGGSMCQPWLTAKADTPDKTIALELRYSFDCETLPDADLELAVEDAQLYTYELNGQPLDGAVTGEWFDPVLKKIAIPADRIVPGYNTLTLRGTYHQQLSGLEAIFLLGSFGVTGQRTMTALPDHLHIGDWCRQGLPNYSGNVTYHHEFKLLARGLKHTIMLEFPQWYGAAIGVSVNGKPEKMLPWPPYKLVLEDLKAGVNSLDITVYGSRRNLCGPFYCKDATPRWTGPLQLKAYDTNERRLVASGLLAEPLVHIAK